MGSAITNHSVFITGTDTGVGKTTITGALLLALQRHRQSIGVLKPIETGVNSKFRHHSDTERLRCLLALPPSFDSVCLYAFSQPLAPLAAARKTGITIDPSRIHSHVATFRQEYSHLLIEGAGGIFTPLVPQFTMRNLIMLLNIPCLIIGHSDLGGFNHCLLTMEALRQVEIKIQGIVLNEYSSQNTDAIIQEQQTSTIELIREWSSVPVYGPIEYTKTLKTNWREGVRKISEDSEIQRLARDLSQREQEIE